MSLELIRALIGDDLTKTNCAIRDALLSPIPLIQQITEHILSAGGKRIRPIIALLSARALACHKPAIIQLAAALELIHTATLLHDDVVDSTTLRRGQKTAHAIWGNSGSVLMGDFLYSRAFQMIVDMKNQAIIDTFAKATHYIAEGEILQLANCHNPDITAEFYFEVIQRKTAKLFELAVELSAMLSEANPATTQAFREYGKHLGLAYQLVDDTLDYRGALEQTGKHIGQDLSEGKTTLPLIYAMQHGKPEEVVLLREAIRAGASNHLEQILEILSATQAIQYALDIAKSHAQQAQNALSLIADSPYRQALYDLSDFVVERTY